MGQAGPGSLAPDLAPSSVRFMIRERGPDTWQVVVYAGRDRATGREVRVRRTVHGGIRRARQVERDLASEAVAARRREHANVTVSELLARWLEHAEPDLAPSTAHTYRSYIDRVIVPRIGTVPIAELTTADLDRLYSALRRTKRKGKNEQPLAAATIRQVHAILRRALRQAVRWGWLDRNPAAEASPPAQGQTRATAPEPDVVVRLLDAAAAIDADVAVFLRLAVITGARRGELCALRWTDVDLDAGSATIARSLTALPGRGIEEKPTKTGGVRLGVVARGWSDDESAVQLAAAALDLPPCGFGHARLIGRSAHAAELHRAASVFDGDTDSCPPLGDVVGHEPILTRDCAYCKPLQQRTTTQLQG